MFSVRKIGPIFLGIILSLTFGWGEEKKPNVFGRETVNEGESALMGMFYDLKQTQTGEPTTVDPDSYSTVLENFLRKGWDESVLNHYYRATKPIYTTQICIPLMDADNGPKAFGLEKRVKPRCWVIHYKGQVVPPHDGTYRFYGYADDLCVVAVDGKLVLQASRGDTPVAPPSPGVNYDAGNDRLRVGKWMDLKASQPVDLDILIGERPGGQFCAFLLVEEKGGNYEMENGVPILPLFQVAPYDTPSYPESVKFSKKASIWKALQ